MPSRWPGERAWIDGRPRAARDGLALAFFSAKEAYYKCQYPVTSRYLGFQDVELEIDEAAGAFEARALTGELPASVARLTGRFAFDDGRVLSGVLLRDAALPV